MGSETKIQWADHTFNPWRGCTKIAPGCANCYADAQSKRNPATLGVWGPNGTRVVAAEDMWRQPLKWDRDCCPQCKGFGVVPDWVGSLSHDLEQSAKDCPTCGNQDYRPRVFCASLADVFEDWPGRVVDHRGHEVWVSTRGTRAWDTDDSSTPGFAFDRRPLKLDDVRARLFATIDATPNLDWLLLTKRIENARRMWPGVTVERDESFDPPKDRAFAMRRDNVWLGVSIACRADLRLLDELRKCRDLCAKTFVSAEPLIEDLGAIDLTGVDWLVTGGESGPNARPCNVDWLRSIVRS